MHRYRIRHPASQTLSGIEGTITERTNITWDVSLSNRRCNSHIPQNDEKRSPFADTSPSTCSNEASATRYANAIAINPREP